MEVLRSHCGSFWPLNSRERAAAAAASASFGQGDCNSEGEGGVVAAAGQILGLVRIRFEGMGFWD